jgi:hypothetical protein
VTVARANRDGGVRPQGVDPAPLRPAFRAAKDGNGAPEVVPLSIEVRQQRVLRALVEEFGGEVTGSALSRCLERQLGWSPLARGSRLIDVLQALHRFGALSLETNGKSDFIVRLLPAGANLYV